MGAADKRVAELLERWRASVELHASYLALDEDTYARVQDWPKHQRPTRWVVELARTRLLELERLADERRSRGDSGFAEALELMAFLTNLLGSEHVERFIPLAQARPTPPPARSKATPPPRPTEPIAAAQSPTPATAPAAGRPPRPRTTEPRTAPGSRPTRATTPSRRRPGPVTGPTVAPGGTPTVADRATATVIADAIRLVSWGREWPQLAGLIARLANRPAEAEVWKILRKHRAEIEAQARRARD